MYVTVCQYIRCRNSTGPECRENKGGGEGTREGGRSVVRIREREGGTKEGGRGSAELSDRGRGIYGLKYDLKLICRHNKMISVDS